VHARSRHLRLPDPQPRGGGAIQNGSADPDSPQFKAADDACKSLLPPSSSVQSPQELEQLVRFAVCMRAHGIEVSDPDPTTGDMTAPYSTRAEAEADPLFQAANAACKDKLPGKKRGPFG
jgi:hypothetical protein